jgi:hypothetical protein
VHAVGIVEEISGDRRSGIYTFLPPSRFSSIFTIGNWRGPVPLLTERTFDALSKTLEGEDKELFLNFVQCFLWGVPDERLSMFQGFMHPWLRGGKLKDTFLKYSDGHFLHYYDYQIAV